MGCGCGGSQQQPVAPGQENAPAPREPVEDRSVWNGPPRKPETAPEPTPAAQQ